MSDDDVLRDAQRLLNDESGIRWTPDKLRVYILDGIRLLYRKHPYSAYVSSVVTSCPTSASGVRDEYRSALAHYTAARCLMEDAADVSNVNVANGFLQLSGLAATTAA
jgi:hypothetical protein